VLSLIVIFTKVVKRGIRFSKEMLQTKGGDVSKNPDEQHFAYGSPGLNV